MALRYPRLLRILGVLFAAEFALLAWEPVSRSTWALENALSVALVALLVASHRAFPLSRLSYLLVFGFLTLHEIGAHYTYSLVPYDELSRRLLGGSLNAALGFERNHYDRLVHFCYGLCFAYPIRELFLRVADVKGVWGYLLPLDVTMSTSMIYELVEWGAAVVFGGEVGQSYLGTQGDEWDAQRDMALATLGALATIAVTLAVNASLRRDLARELAESLRVKHPDPLGEEAIERLLNDGEQARAAEAQRAQGERSRWG
jgi:putative membrane protein